MFPILDSPLFMPTFNLKRYVLVESTRMKRKAKNEALKKLQQHSDSEYSESDNQFEEIKNSEKVSFAIFNHLGGF